MRLAEIELRVASMGQLQQIVGAMRSLASMRLQEAERSLESVREYGQAMAEAVRAVLRLDRNEHMAAPRADSARRALVLCTSEQGFVGGLNERLLEAAQAHLDPADTLLILGSRGAALAAERGHRVDWSHPMATRLASIPELVRQVEAALYPRIARAQVMRVDVIFARHRRSGGIAVLQHQLLPLDLAASAPAGARARAGEVKASSAAGPPPLHNLPDAPLLEGLTSQYLFARLAEAATEALAGENGARFAAMESAHDNVSHKLEQLRQQALQSRQEEVTTELLDLVIGGQAIGT